MNLIQNLTNNEYVASDARVNDSSRQSRIIVKSRPARHISKSSAKNSYDNGAYPQQVALTGAL